MMWFTADLHLGDTNILHDMDRPFGSVEEMNRKVIDAINECVAADDRLYILGDFTYRLPLAEAVRLRERIECQNVTLIRGNHDGDWEDSDVPQIWEDVRDYLEIAPGYAKGHRLVMSHYPMLSWNGKARGAIMLHGHIHKSEDQVLVDRFSTETRAMMRKSAHQETAQPVPCQMINCFCMYSDYTPLTLEEWVECDQRRRDKADR